MSNKNSGGIWFSSRLLENRSNSSSGQAVPVRRLRPQVPGEEQADGSHEAAHRREAVPVRALRHQERQQAEHQVPHEDGAQSCWQCESLWWLGIGLLGILLVLNCCLKLRCVLQYLFWLHVLCLHFTISLAFSFICICKLYFLLFNVKFILTIFTKCFYMCWHHFLKCFLYKSYTLEIMKIHYF